MVDGIQHFSHDHRLVRIGLGCTVLVSCSLCNHADIPGEDSSYSGYGCRDCVYFIHKTCAELPQQIDHPLHTQHLLTLAKRSITSFCYYCEKPFENEYTYACEKCALHMHIRCAITPLPTITKREDGNRDGDEYRCHGESMKLVEADDHGMIKLGKAKLFLCFACHSPWSGPAYSCASEKCDTFLHRTCVDKLPREIQRHPLHTRHALALQVSKPRPCLSCCKKDCRLVYACREEGCDFHLGMECAFLDTRVKCRSHDHDLCLIERSSCDDIHCYACQKSYNEWPDRALPEEVNRTRALLFRCVECDFNLHFLCGPLPSKVKYEYHSDFLTLVDHSVTEGHSDEHYCDACEKEIKDTQFRVYYCKDCKYVTHIHCVISEIMSMIKGDMTTNIRLKSFGEERWEVGIESMDEKADNVDDPTQKNGEAKELTTLKDIYESLTNEEKNKLADPFGFDDPSDKLYRQSFYDFYRQQNSARFDRRDSIFDDVDVIQRLFDLDSSSSSLDFYCFLGEIRYYTPAENLKLDEMFLRQQVEDVKGYKVPKTLAHILKALLHKRGDLGGDQDLTPGMKSVASTHLCIVVDEMCRIRAEDITKDDLKRWYSCLEAIRKISGLEVIELYSFRDFVVRIFLGLETTRLRRDVGEGLNQKIAKLKDKLKRCEESLERLEKCAPATATSSFMKECLSEASEWKGKLLGDKWF